VRRIGSLLVPGLADGVAIESGGRTLLRLEPEGDPARSLQVPLTTPGERKGTLTLEWTAARGRADEVDAAYARTLAGRAALALANAELIAELSSTRERLESTLGALAEAVTVHDEAGQTIYANDAAVRLLGASSREEVLTAEPGELAARFEITKEDGSPVALEELPGRRLVQGEEAPALLTRSIERRTGRARWLLTKATPTRDAEGNVLAVNIIEDVTEAKEAELRQRFLAQAGAVLAGSLDYQETLERVAELAVPAMADWCAVDIVTDRGKLERVAIAHIDPAKVEFGWELHRRYPPDLSSDAGVGAVVRGGEAQLYPEITDELLEATARDDEHRRIIREVGLRSAMVVPMRSRGATTGLLSFVGSTRTFDADDLAFAQDVATLAATAVENARLYTERRTASETLQRSLLPDRLPDVPGWRTASTYRPGAPGAEVGGDFYDVFRFPGGGHMVVLGDVTGKGVQAAALTSLARHTIRAAAQFDPQPSAVLGLLNRILREQPSPSLVTAACARLDPGGLVTVAAAGHPLPLRAGVAGGAMEVGAHGILLGAADDMEWAESFARMVPGDTLLFYTDGITDMPGESGRFGEQRLAQLVADSPRDPEQLLAGIETALAEFQSGSTVDDRAMLAVQCTGTEEIVGGPGPRLAGGVRTP